MTTILRDVSVVAPTLSPRSRHALNVLEKCGEMILDTSGYFTSTSSRSGVDSADMERLARLGFARMDFVGDSTFAVFVRRP